MMIALVSDEYPPATIRGGIGTYSKALAGLLGTRGKHEVHVFCQSDSFEKQSAGETIHAVAPWDPKWRPARIVYHRLIAPIFGPIEHKVRWGISVGKAVLTTERTLGRKFDVIEVPEAGGFGRLLRLAGVDTAMLIRLHTGTAILRRHARQRPNRQDKLVFLLERWSIKKGDLVTSPTRALVRESIHDLDIKEDDCLVYPNLQPPVTPSSGRPSTTQMDQRTVLVVGRLGKYKGTDLVLRAVANLQAKGYPELRLILIGRSEWSRPELEAMVARTLRPGTCEIRGEVDHREAIAAMRSATMLVQASRYDNYPNTILEALQNGCLVVASDVGGIPEIIDDRRTGLLFECGNAEALEGQIKWVLEHPEESAGMASAGSAWVYSELSDGKILDSITSAYQKTMQQAIHHRKRPT
jgi:glycosyltransferase involved in cell wall biosynthesis